MINKITSPMLYQKTITISILKCITIWFVLFILYLSLENAETYKILIYYLTNSNRKYFNIHLTYTHICNINKYQYNSDNAFFSSISKVLF